jgi:hypothetical protein
VYSFISDERVHTRPGYGFRQGTAVSDVTGLVREVLHSAQAWGMPLLIACQDIQTAFDSLPHELIKSSLLASGVAANDVG